MNKCSPVALWAAVTVLAASSIGCSSTSTCTRDDDSIDVYGYVNADRTVFTSIDTTALEAAAEDSGQGAPQFAYFPANRSITFHVGLAAYPTDIDVYLAFTPYGDATVAPGAGNMSLIRKRSKDEIVLHNDTCSEFWVWLTASTSATSFQQVSDAGIDPSAAGASGSDPGDVGGAPGAP